jgi:type II secretion system protein E
MARTIGQESIDLAQVVADSEALKLVPQDFARRNRVLPIAFDPAEHVLTSATTQIFNVVAMDQLRAIIGPQVEIKTSLASEAQLEDYIDQFYGYELSVDGILTEIETGEIDYESLQVGGDEYTQPMVRLVNALLVDAVKRGASDIHFEPEYAFVRIRYRIDGVLASQSPPPRELKAAIISRVKLMAKLNIAERRLPQDGRIKVKTLGREVDLRVSTLPTLYGESVVMRLLDRSATSFYDLESLGFDAHMLRRMEYYTSLPHGILLVTGPTGSGKSTTLYSALKRINQTDKKIITIEDPVEYQMDGINQIHVNPQIGLTFAGGLRHIVRQDPDVIMVGEIRDQETADIAIRAALTGHFVYSTLHTNDAPSAITRLTVMGVENYLLTSSLVAVLAQRLVRVICPQCRQPDGQATTPKGERVPAFRGAGCDHCFGTGYRGRVGIFELMELNEELRAIIMRNEDASVITAAAYRHGMRNLRDDGWEKVARGVTTADEVMRVTQEF